MTQASNKVILIRPKHFGFNQETAETNTFQKKVKNKDTQSKVVAEFNHVVDLLITNGINVLIIEDRDDVVTTDSIFSNDWVIYMPNGDIFICPMATKSRRVEKRYDIKEILENNGLAVNKVHDLSYLEETEDFVEGNGSLVLDWENKIAYAARSFRTSENAVNEFCKLSGYKPVIFDATYINQGKETSFYHTDLVISIAHKYAILCKEAIKSKTDLDKILTSLKETRKEVIEISLEQSFNLCANVILLKNDKDQYFLFMSKNAYSHLTQDQIKAIEKYNKIITPSIETIETVGGGGINCMISENHIPKR